MMDLIQVNCPYCGWELHIPINQRELFCMQCGKKFIRETKTQAPEHAEWEYVEFKLSISGDKKPISVPRGLKRLDFQILSWKTLQRDLEFVEAYQKYLEDGWEAAAEIGPANVILEVIPKIEMDKNPIAVLINPQTSVGTTYYIKSMDIVIPMRRRKGI